eukprot:PhM_4_TR17360/c0_g1_i3/m.21567/K02966/RP-S19e, RPS19; small subunit ribosomal protein S19e
MVKDNRRRGGVCVKDVEPAKWIAAFAGHLKQQGSIEVPEFVDYAKTGPNRILPPQNADWYYVKAAAVLRRVYLRPFTGIGGLRKVFGKCWGLSRPVHFQVASGGVLRKVLQSLEKLGLVAKSNDGGRVITKAARRDCDRVAMKVLGKQVRMVGPKVARKAGATTAKRK